MTTFLRLLQASVDDKPVQLVAATAALSVHRETALPPGTVFERDSSLFSAIPGSPFAYWASESILRIFGVTPALHSGGTIVVSTNPLNDDFRYVRAWWEVRPRGDGPWKSWAKGGGFSPIYYDVDTIIQWDSTRES
jgi:hypothetical protein